MIFHTLSKEEKRKEPMMPRSRPVIPEGSTLQTLANGDVLITLPGADVPTYCVQKDRNVRIAIARDPVEEAIAQAARDYVDRHRTG